MRGRLPVGALLVTALLPGCAGEGQKSLERAYRIPSPAMRPTLNVGDFVRADLLAYKHRPPRRGDVVVFHPPKGAVDQRGCGVPSEPADGRPCERPTGGPDPGVAFLKRVVALPGDWLKVENNMTFLGKTRRGPFTRQPEPFVLEGTPCGELCNLRKPIQVPPGHYYTMGDNRGESDDSRNWGPVPAGNLIGKVVSGLD